MAGATTLGELASAIGARAEEAAIVADLKAGSETDSSSLRRVVMATEMTLNI